MHSLQGYTELAIKAPHRSTAEAQKKVEATNKMYSTLPR